MAANIKVAIRCRPLNHQEEKSNASVCLTCDAEQNTLLVNAESSKKAAVSKHMGRALHFERVFGMYSDQSEVFDAMVRPMVDDAMSGFNCTIFAYGPTGTGKTHTMEGDVESEEDKGIILRATEMILENMPKQTSDFNIKMSLLEIYNEELSDLLAGGRNGKSTVSKPIRLCEDIKKGVVVQNLEEITVLSLDMMKEHLKRGIENRVTAATLKNQNSSRSHTILTLKITSINNVGGGEEVMKCGQLNIVDLAGSESIGRSGARGERAREAGSINQSLLTLGRVIMELADAKGAKGQHRIPYRDSKLTRLLQDSLGGKAKTSIIATLSPSSCSLEETLSTLDYALRAKNVKNQPLVNEQVQARAVGLKEYFQEIEALKQQLNIARQRDGVFVDPTVYAGMETKIATLQTQLHDSEKTAKAAQQQSKEDKEARQDLEENLRITTTKLSISERNLEQRTRELVIAEKDLKVVTDELHKRYVELRAVEGVVKEQVVTEDKLRYQGQELKTDLTALHAKMETMLMEVDALVSNGRIQCKSLATSLDYAVQNLRKETEAARDSTLSSCDGLEQRLSTTNTNSQAALTSIQHSLEAWGGDMSVGLTQAQEQLQQQQSQFFKMSNNLKEHTEVMSASNKRFLERQELLKKESEQTARNLRQKMQETLETMMRTAMQEMDDHTEQLSGLHTSVYESCVTQTQEMTEASDKVNEEQHSLLQNVVSSCTTAESTLSILTERNIEQQSQGHASLQDVVITLDSSIKNCSGLVKEAVGTVSESSGKLLGFSTGLGTQQQAVLQIFEQDVLGGITGVVNTNTNTNTERGRGRGRDDDSDSDNGNDIRHYDDDEGGSESDGDEEQKGVPIAPPSPRRACRKATEFIGEKYGELAVTRDHSLIKADFFCDGRRQDLIKGLSKELHNRRELM